MYNYEDETWTDLLTSYDGENIEYDEIGNPTSYLGYSMSWNGRELASLSGNGITAGYKYDSDGLRSYKKVGDTETYYQYVGDRLMYEKRGDIDLRYGYNSFGDLAVIKYTHDGTTYTYYVVCNSRGDVENIYHSNGTVMCHYTYDSWGNVISAADANGNEITNPANIGLVNPIRYRGYYYDSETGYYYLQSRYYNPQVGRFLNSDAYFSTGQGMNSCNMFLYCGNNPFNRIDSTGTSWKSIKNFFNRVKKAVTNFVKSVFGAGSSVTTTAKYEETVIPDPYPITAKCGTKTTVINARYGNSKKLISVYANYETSNPVLSSNAGIKLNISKAALDVSLGFDDISIKGSVTYENTTSSFALKANISELKIGFETSNTVQWDINTAVTTYTNASINGWLVVAIIYFLNTGQEAPAPQYAY